MIISLDIFARNFSPALRTTVVSLTARWGLAYPTGAGVEVKGRHSRTTVNAKRAAIHKCMQAFSPP